MNRLAMLLLALMTTGFLSACADDKHYPLSGEECAPGDPVQDLEPVAADCVPGV
ncbi:hypothetical protein [Roseovarius sp.]|uniref:hypothetical protein n=1 Tax=Roseovarius sp. TaxID=1486281 RepID=UPI0025CEB7C2|nr:hypothetical protein [Roseovarius sp.]